MPSLAQLREALRTVLHDGLPDMAVYEYLVSSPSLPALMIGLHEEGVEYDVTGSRGLDRVVFTVLALAGTATDQGAQMILDELLEGAGSVKALLEADTTLGGLVGRDGVRVMRATRYDEYATAESQSSVLGCQFHVEVYTPG